MIKRFNDRFFNEEYYEASHPDPFHLLLEDNRILTDDIFEDVIEFCMSTEVYKQLGLNPIDILSNFDMPTYYRLKEIVFKHMEERHKAFDKTKSEMEKRQQDLLKGKK